MATTPKRVVELPPSLTPEHPDYAGRERYDLPQAALYLDMSRCILYRECADGKIGHRIGTMRRFLFTQHDLDLYRAARRRGPAQTTDTTTPGIPRVHVGARAKSQGSVLPMPKVRRFS